MPMKNLFLILIASVLCFTACENKEQKLTELKSEVLAIHDDEAMPKMSEISSLRRMIKAELSDNAELDSARIEEFQQTMVLLEEANEAMMVWMREFDVEMEELNPEEKEAYLTNELASIKSVRDRMLSAIEIAEKQLFKKE
jgi:hypothetical protein